MKVICSRKRQVVFKSHISYYVFIAKVLSIYTFYVLNVDVNVTFSVVNVNHIHHPNIAHTLPIKMEELGNAAPMLCNSIYYFNFVNFILYKIRKIVRAKVLRKHVCRENTLKRERETCFRYL